MIQLFDIGVQRFFYENINWLKNINIKVKYLLTFEIHLFCQMKCETFTLITWQKLLMFHQNL